MEQKGSGWGLGTVTKGHFELELARSTPHSFWSASLPCIGLEGFHMTHRTCIEVTDLY